MELEDLSRFPALLRDGGTAYLAFATRISGHAKVLAPKLAEALKAAGTTEIVDLCSGGGGPVGLIADELHAQGVHVHVTLTDRFPNLRAYAHAAEGSGDRIGWETSPVDATAVPPHLTGLRTIFNAFHHFRPDAARAILADAAHAGRPIAIFELVSREPVLLLAILTSPLVVTLTVPFWRPFRWWWLLFAWVIPLLQPFILWDGVVSWLRIYGEDELRELVAGIDAPGYVWDIGKIKLGDAPAHATYLIGRKE